MKWEDLKVYKPLSKESLKPSFQEFVKLIGHKLEPHGFKKKGRKLLRLTNDLIEVIDLDYRGSWSGQNEYFETNLGLVPYCWPGLVNEYYPIARREIKELDQLLKNHYRLTQEYELLADYLYRAIVKSGLPYFEKYNSTEKVLKRASDFKYKTLNGGNDIYNSHLLILFSELKQQTDRNASKILAQQIDYLERLSTNLANSKKNTELTETVAAWTSLQRAVQSKNWTALIEQFDAFETQELRKVGLKKAANTTVK